MVIPAKKAREITFLILYCLDQPGIDDQGLEEMVRREIEISKKSFREGKEKVLKIQEYLPTIDLIIERVSLSYEFARIQSVEKNVLRLGAYEILYDAIPSKMAISEAIRLAKKFSTPASCQFVNAILDNIYKESIGQAIDETEIHTSSKALEAEEKSNKA